MSKRYDAVVVGSGPNGLAAAITVAARGGSVIVFEGAADVGGGMRSDELTLPGFLHDTCSAVHPLGVSSPFFRLLPLQDHGLEWLHPVRDLAHPLDDGTAVGLEQSFEKTVAGLGDDGENYRNLIAPFAERPDDLIEEVMRPPLHLPKHPVLLARFGLKAIQPAERLADGAFQGARARALFSGIAAHSMIPLSWHGSSAVALTLAVAAHARGWPIPRGGSRSIARALVSYLRSFGGEIRVGERVTNLEQLPPSRWIFLDVTPKQLVELGARRLSESQKRRLLKFRYGMGVFKMDFALSQPIPWKAQECKTAGTVHLGGTGEEIALSELSAQEGKVSEAPFVLLAQPSLIDSARAPYGNHVAWGYCHVPSGSTVDMSTVIENQIERFAPGFRSTILAKSARGPDDLEKYNPNYVGGDIAAGALNLRQLLFRPRVGLSPYSTPIPGVFLCSSSTPPGPGVHGMCGYWAAQAALKADRRAALRQG